MNFLLHLVWNSRKKLFKTFAFYHLSEQRNTIMTFHSFLSLKINIFIKMFWLTFFLNKCSFVVEILLLPCLFAQTKTFKASTYKKFAPKRLRYLFKYKINPYSTSQSIKNHSISEFFPKQRQEMILTKWFSTHMDRMIWIYLFSICAQNCRVRLHFIYVHMYSPTKFKVIVADKLSSKQKK